MTSSMSLTDKESFDNYLDYKDDIEYDCSLTMSIDNMDYFDLAVLKELHTRNLINYAFYKKQCETIKMVHTYRENLPQMSYLGYFLYILMIFIIIIVVIGVVVWSILSKHPTWLRMDIYDDKSL